MSPPDALPDIRNVLSAGDMLGNETPRHIGDITNSERGIGAGTLGQAFRARHMTKSQELLAAAAALPPVLQQLGEAGLTAVEVYQDTDTALVEEFSRSGLTGHVEFN